MQQHMQSATVRAAATPVTAVSLPSSSATPPATTAAATAIPEKHDPRQRQRRLRLLRKHRVSTVALALAASVSVLLPLPDLAAALMPFDTFRVSHVAMRLSHCQSPATLLRSEVPITKSVRTVFPDLDDLNEASSYFLDQNKKKRSEDSSSLERTRLVANSASSAVASIRSRSHLNGMFTSRTFSRYRSSSKLPSRSATAATTTTATITASRNTGTPLDATPLRAVSSTATSRPARPSKSKGSTTTAAAKTKATRTTETTLRMTRTNKKSPAAPSLESVTRAAKTAHASVRSTCPTSNPNANTVANPMDPDSKTSATRTKRPKRRRRKWDTMIVRLEEYYNKNGHSMVGKWEDPDLYKWAQSVRKNYSHQVRYPDRVLPNRPRLSNEDMERLTRLGFCWNVTASMWDRRYKQLQEFHARHGHCRVSSSDDTQLNIFVQNQRQEYRRLKQFGADSYQSTLTPQRIHKLNLINFQWADTRKSSWEKQFKALEKFVRAFGHADVPQNYDSSPSLGRWCMNQRTKYRNRQLGKATSLTDEQIERLEAVGFSWNTREAKWQHMLHRLIRFHEENGHIEIPRADDRHNDLRLWLIWQRFLYNTMQRNDESFYVLSQDRIDQLESSIPDFSWRARESNGPSKDDWSKLFVAMQEKGIKPGMRAKQHWFEGLRPHQMEVKSEYTDDEIMELWNAGDDEDEDEDEYEGAVDDEVYDYGAVGDEVSDYGFGELV